MPVYNSDGIQPATPQPGTAVLGTFSFGEESKPKRNKPKKDPLSLGALTNKAQDRGQLGMPIRPVPQVQELGATYGRRQPA